MQHVQHGRDDIHLHAIQDSPHNALEEDTQTARVDHGRQMQAINNVPENRMTPELAHEDEDDVERTRSVDSMISLKSRSITFRKQFIESLYAYMACLQF